MLPVYIATSESIFQFKQALKVRYNAYVDTTIYILRKMML